MQNQEQEEKQEQVLDSRLEQKQKSLLPYPGFQALLYPVSDDDGDSEADDYGGGADGGADDEGVHWTLSNS